MMEAQTETDVCVVLCKAVLDDGKCLNSTHVTTHIRSATEQIRNRRTAEARPERLTPGPLTHHANMIPLDQ